MSRYAISDPDSPGRHLARSLLDEALAPPAPHGFHLPPIAPPSSGAKPSVTGARAQWTAQAALQALRAFVQRTNRLPTAKDWAMAKRQGIPARATVVRCWASLDAAYQAAGLDGVVPPAHKGSRKKGHATDNTPGARSRRR